MGRGPVAFSAAISVSLSHRVHHETFDGVGHLLIGRNTGTPVSHEYKAPFVFTGKLDKVTVELK